ncbi:hypothetical protein ES288_A01G153800v1 [Gossypium darwinii]|uniref:Uncharacterized protein n=1 Tax=Gossypium darwinii TaxID=34276 RepID=A0A5D2HP34_GOSDA|nr:hypothetical protein ES288_A01G153800v1 [Gossypium darwinii]
MDLWRVNGEEIFPFRCKFADEPRDEGWAVCPRRSGAHGS